MFKDLFENPYVYTVLWTFATVIFILLTSFAIGSAARTLARWAGKHSIEQDNAFAGYMFASPWMLGFLIFVLFPMLASLYWSFTSYRLGDPIEMVWFENYRRLLFEDKEFRGS